MVLVVEGVVVEELLDQIYVYGETPPETVAVAVPVEVPPQLTLVCETAKVRTGGCVILVVNVAIQECESVTVQL